MAGALWGVAWTFFLFVPAVILTCLLKPVWGLYLMTVALFFPDHFIQGLQAYPADIILFLIVVGFWAQRIRGGKIGFVRTPIDWPIIIWMVVLALSLVSAFDVTRGIVNWLRHLQLFLLFYSVVGLVDEHRAQKIIGLMIVIALFFAAMNLVPFLKTGASERVFGPVGVVLSGILTLSIVYITGRMCFEQCTAKFRLMIVFLFVLILGQIANLSRGASIVTVAGIVLSFLMAWHWAHRNGDIGVKHRILWFAGLGFILIAIVGLSQHSVVEQLVKRFQGIGNAGATMQYRYFVWQSAVNAFWENPFLGIGLGQIQVWYNFFPDMRLDPVGRLTFGVGSHNTMLKYLAEAGVFGIAGLLWIFGKVSLLGRATVHATISRSRIGHLIGLWSVTITIIGRAFLEGHAFYSIGGMTTVLFIGMAVQSFLDIKSNSTKDISQIYRRANKKIPDDE